MPALEATLHCPGQPPVRLRGHLLAAVAALLPHQDVLDQFDRLALRVDCGDGQARARLLEVPLPRHPGG